MARLLLACTFLVLGSALAATGRGAPGQQKESSLVQTWEQALNGGSGKTHDTPVTRAVNLLKEMHKTLAKEMDEDKALHDKLGCWCNDNKWEKKNAIEAETSKIDELNSTIAKLTAQSNGLVESLAQIRQELAADKDALAKASALREKELAAFHASEVDSIQAVENLKAAILVLEKHHGAALPQMPLSLLSVKQDRRQEPFGMQSADSISLGVMVDGMDVGTTAANAVTPQRSLRAGAEAVSWSQRDLAVVRKALHAASGFMQSHHEEGYYPAYTAQSGEIMGVLKQLKEEMEANLSEEQKTELARATAFAELRSAKEAEIANGEKMEERKEDELANTNNDLAEAKEDLAQQEAMLAEDQQFMVNLQKTCTDADKNFEARRKARLEEIKAVSDAINILTQDEAKDTFRETFGSPTSFLQISSHDRSAAARKQAANLLRSISVSAKDPQLSLMANAVELDAFTRVKKAIDDMIAMLKVQQEDEVKKRDWCTSELQTNTMATTKTQDEKVDLETEISVLEDKAQTLTQEIAKAKSDIVELQVSLQRASENRKAENMEFQRTIAEQTTTIEVLHAALERLADYYDKENFVQTGHKQKSRQTPPVPQMEYKPSEAAGGAMQLLEKLIYDAKELQAQARTAEQSAQTSYEAMVADTNASVAELMRSITSKTQAKADTAKSKMSAEEDLANTEKELEGLSKYDAELHADCDYLLRNFDVRQQGRAQEVEALQQAKQILSGADLSS